MRAHDMCRKQQEICPPVLLTRIDSSLMSISFHHTGELLVCVFVTTNFITTIIGHKYHFHAVHCVDKSSYNRYNRKIRKNLN